MKIKCGNGENQDERKISVCHHCGMPVCDDHGWVVASDNAFAEKAGTAWGPKGSAPSPGASQRDAVTIPRPAMHCRKCVDEFHGGAAKRHGWADPRQAPQGFPAPTGRP
jgi:hypothetical protein